MTASEENARIQCEVGSNNEVVVYNCYRDKFETKSFKFPGGELQVELPDHNVLDKGSNTVVARIQSSEDLVRLILATEIVKRHSHYPATLIVPYFPYARQDRMTDQSVAFSLKPITSIINLLGYNRVLTVDPHSDVTTALLDNMGYIPQHVVVQQHAHLNGRVNRNVIVVGPDAGAQKKAMAIAKVRGSDFLSASKIRDVKTGKITGTSLGYEVPVSGRDCLIVDDICDGGRTFAELAMALRSAGARKIYLYVTHGIFSKGLKVFDGLIDEIYTTDTYLSPYVESAPNLYVQEIVRDLV